MQRNHGIKLVLLVAAMLMGCSYSRRPEAMQDGMAKGNVQSSRFADPFTDEQFNSGDTFTPKQVRTVKDVSDQPTSTFSIDVDTASYTFCRQQLLKGFRPQSEAVRVEEFLNYFHYNYPQPKDPKHPFSITTDVVTNPFAPDKHFIRIGLQGREVEPRQRKAMNLVFLVDNSGSMHGADRLGLVKYSLRVLLNNLRPGDTVALCSYGGSVTKIMDPTPIEKKGDIIEAIEKLGAGGGTPMASGINLAYELASKNLDKNKVNRVIICSDGDANIGQVSHEQILDMIGRYVKRGVTVTTLGFGVGNYKDVMMEQLANKGNGNYFYIDSQAQAKRVFLKDIMGTLQVIAKDVKIQVQFNEWVKSYRLVGYENRALRNEDFTNDKVDAGEIGSGHQVTALYEVTLSEKALADATNLPGFGTVKIRAKAPEGSESVEYETVMNKTIHSVENAPKDLQFAVAVVGFAEILRKSPHAENWKMDRVAAVLKSSAIENERDYLEFGEVFKAGGKLRP